MDFEIHKSRFILNDKGSFTILYMGIPRVVSQFEFVNSY
jgi:hypothetical protein